MKAERFICVRDETLRDGSQQPGINLNSDQRRKLALISALLLKTPTDEFRNQIDLGMPETSNPMLETILQISREILCISNVDIFVTGRSTRKAIDTMCESLREVPEEKRIIAPFIGISEEHRTKLGLSKVEILEKIEREISYAINCTCRVHFPLEGGYDACLQDLPYFLEVIRSLQEIGVEAIVLCDTVGKALPFGLKSKLSYGDVVSVIKQNFPSIKVSVHCHDDFGLAIANTLEGVIKGADIVDGTFFGIGERAGNASLQTLLTLLVTRKDLLDILIFADLNNLYQISMQVQEILGIKVADNIPVVGRNSFSHSSGIHQDGILKDPKVYQPYEPRFVGREGHNLVLGYLSGKRGIEFILKNNYGLSLSEEQLEIVTSRFKESFNMPGTPEEKLLKIVHDVLVSEQK
ncbi:MAG: LeuA family protein [Patescibacteria group bacterium]|nr:LeuA family protein [Patescibacteria group bacterium]